MARRREEVYDAVVGQLSAKRAEVYTLIHAHGPGTRDEILQHMEGGPEKEIKAARARFNDLCKQGVIEKAEKRACNVTGRKSDVWDLAETLVAQSLSSGSSAAKQSWDDPEITVQHDSSCVRCELRHQAQKVCVRGRGPEPADILFVGEAPGPREDKAGRAMVGPSGTVLEAVMEQVQAAYPDLTFRVSNLVRCFPGRDDANNFNKPRDAHVRACYSYLLREIEAVQPSVIVPLGGTAAKYLAGDGRITRVRGIEVSWRAPGWDEEQESIPVIPTYHPAFILRSDSDARLHEMIADVMIAARIVSGEADEERNWWMPETFEEVNEVLDRIERLHAEGAFTSLSIDVETDGDKNAEPMARCYGDGEILTCQIAWCAAEAVLIPLHHPESPFAGQPEVRAIERRLAQIVSTIPSYGHNYKYDAHWMKEKWGVWPIIDFDTMVAHQVLFTGTRPNELYTLASWYCGMGGYERKLREFVNGIAKDTPNYFRKIPLREILVEYGCGDVIAPLLLRQQFEEQLQEEELASAFGLVMSAYSAMCRMEHEGFTVDFGVHREMSDTYLELEAGPAELALRTSPFYKLWVDRAGIELNLGSPNQLRAFFYEVLGCMVTRRTDKGEASTDKQALEEIRETYPQYRKIVDSLLTVRTVKKFHSTYLVGLDKYLFADGRVHPDYDLTGTRTGRLSAKHPPIHNIPRGSLLRRMFRSRWGDQGCILQLDYSQAELRVFAMLSGDEEYREVFRRGEDPHKFTAAAVLFKSIEAVTKEERNLAKTVNFGILYGRSAKAIAEVTSMTEREAQEFIDALFVRFPKLKTWIDQHKLLGKQNHAIWTPFQRRRLLPEDKNDAGKVERQAVNTIIQSAASDFTLISAISVDRLMQQQAFHSRLISFIHDALVFDTFPAEVGRLARLAQDVMTSIPRLYGWARDVPMAADPEVGPSWGEKCKLTLVEGGYDIRGPMDSFARMKWLFRENTAFLDVQEVTDEGKTFEQFLICVRESPQTGIQSTASAVAHA